MRRNKGPFPLDGPPRKRVRTHSQTPVSPDLEARRDQPRGTVADKALRVDARVQLRTFLFSYHHEQTMGFIPLSPRVITCLGPGTLGMLQVTLW